MSEIFTLVVLDRSEVRTEEFSHIGTAMQAYRQAILDVTSKNNIDKAPASLHQRYAFTNGVTLLAPDYHVIMTVTLYPWDK
jgi:hypothetical protein